MQAKKSQISDPTSLTNVVLSSDRVVAEISLSQIKKNFKSLSQFVGNKSVIPMVKANAYGHGMTDVSRALVDEPGLFALGVASFDEAMTLRQSGIQTDDSSIIIFSNVTGISVDLIQLCDQHKFIPVISNLDDLKSIIRSSAQVPYHLKFNTGMNRLGIGMKDLETALKLIKESDALPQGVLTHLATSENPKHPLSKTQKEHWIHLRQTFKNLSPRILTHFANSGAIMEKKFWETETLTDIIRPGISLYGIQPKPGKPSKKCDIEPALKLKSKVLTSRQLKAKDCVGYGATYQAKKSHPMAVIASGYADGVHRILSRNEYSGLKILGTISMDMIAIQTQTLLKPGTWVEILGKNTDWWQEAQKASTIPYEILTSLSGRVKRIYV
ncbi:MAG: alanine racemase [Xanthomonadaceae bacterium]|nr:alanine racemase [Xanthomonadaceae bacterium]